MAFGGTPVATALGKNIIRVSGATLAAGAAGTISDNGGGGDVELPVGHAGVTIANTIALVNHFAAPAAGTPNFIVAKAAGLITVTNNDGVNATGELEIWVMEPHSLMK